MPMYTEKDQIVNTELISSLKAGNPLAFKQVFLLYERRLYHFVFSITKSEYISEEIVQEAFTRIWVNRDSLDPFRSFESFIFTVARHLTYNYLRDAARRESIREEMWMNISIQQQHVDSELILAEYNEIVEDIVRNLPQQKRSIYELSRRQGKSNSEIAAMLGISPKTVKNHLWNTMSTIRSQLKPYLEETIRLMIYFMIFLN